MTGKKYIDFLRAEFKVNVDIAGDTADDLKDNESYYYNYCQESCFNMPLTRMDSCGGLIISPYDLVQFAQGLSDDTIEQRGSLDGNECFLMKKGPITGTIFCNKRKNYKDKLPLKGILESLMQQ